MVNFTRALCFSTLYPPAARPSSLRILLVLAFLLSSSLIVVLQFQSGDKTKGLKCTKVSTVRLPAHSRLHVAALVFSPPRTWWQMMETEPPKAGCGRNQQRGLTSTHSSYKTFWELRCFIPLASKSQRFTITAGDVWGLSPIKSLPKSINVHQLSSEIDMSFFWRLHQVKHHADQDSAQGQYNRNTRVQQFPHVIWHCAQA